MKEVIPGIYQMTLTLSGFNPDSINVYIIKADNGYLLVDTGWDTPPAVDSMQHQLAEASIHFTDIKRVVVTHCHVDHLGMIGRYKKSHNAEITLHKNEIELIKVRFRDGDQFIPLTDAFLQIHGVPRAELIPPEFQIPAVPNLTEPDVLLQGGEEIQVGNYAFKVINTPGHTPGHISLYEPRKKFLISGDVLLPTISTNAAFHVQHIDNPLKKYADSLIALRQLDIDLVLPGHEYIFSNPRVRIDELIRRQAQKGKVILNVFKGGRYYSAYDVSKILSWSPGTQTSKWFGLSGWDRRFAVLQTVAYLEEMAGDGKLSRFSLDGKIYYR